MGDRDLPDPGEPEIGFLDEAAHRDLDITQKSAWYLAHRLHKIFAESEHMFSGSVETDETYFGGKRRNMNNGKRKELKGRGPAGKVTVAGIKDRATKQIRATVVECVDKATLRGFVMTPTAFEAIVCADEAAVYESLSFVHESVKHSVSEYVRDKAYTNGVESF